MSTLTRKRRAVLRQPPAPPPARMNTSLRITVRSPPISCCRLRSAGGAFIPDIVAHQAQRAQQRRPVLQMRGENTFHRLLRPLRHQHVQLRRAAHGFRPPEPRSTAGSIPSSPPGSGWNIPSEWETCAGSAAPARRNSPASAWEFRTRGDGLRAHRFRLFGGQRRISCASGDSRSCPRQRARQQEHLRRQNVLHRAPRLARLEQISTFVRRPGADTAPAPPSPGAVAPRSSAASASSDSP